MASLLQMIARFGNAALSRARNIYYRALGVRLHGYVWMRKIEIPRNFHLVELGESVSLDSGVVLLCSERQTQESMIVIGARTYVNRSTFIDATHRITIGQDCAIGPGCYITDHDHGMSPGVAPLLQPMIGKPTTIGDGVWIGAHACVLKGVTIGAGAVIGAGSVVTHDIPCNVIAAGIPARVLRSKSDQP